MQAKFYKVPKLRSFVTTSHNFNDLSGKFPTTSNSTRRFYFASTINCNECNKRNERNKCNKRNERNKHNKCNERKERKEGNEREVLKRKHAEEVQFLKVDF